MYVAAPQNYEDSQYGDATNIDLREEAGQKEPIDKAQILARPASTVEDAEVKSTAASKPRVRLKAKAPEHSPTTSLAESNGSPPRMMTSPAMVVQTADPGHLETAQLNETRADGTWG